MTDKLLTNYFFVGLIHLLFPNAKIIHTMRDPVDTCLVGLHQAVQGRHAAQL